jgi:hypothetical protein
MYCSLCPDRFIRGYRLRPPAEIGKWEEKAGVKCENAAAHGFALQLFVMASQMFAAMPSQPRGEDVAPTVASTSRCGVGRDDHRIDSYQS